MKLCLFLVANLTVYVFGITRITVYEYTNYRGRSATFSNLEAYTYGYLVGLNDRVTSIALNQGSCYEAYEHGGAYILPAGRFFWATTSLSYVGTNFYNVLSSFKACGRTSVSLVCPAGKYVKRIDWNTDLRNGVRLYCYTPSEITTTATLNHLQSASYTFPRSTECIQAIRGIQFGWHSGYDAYTSMTPSCAQQTSTGQNRFCSNTQRMSGIQITFETRTRYMKSAGIYCRDWNPNVKGANVLTANSTDTLISLPSPSSELKISNSSIPAVDITKPDPIDNVINLNLEMELAKMNATSNITFNNVTHEMYQV